MPYIATTAVKKLLSLSKRIKGVQGGTSASKTVSILQILIDLAQSEKEIGVTSVTSESMPHLKRGAMRDFLNIMKDHRYYVESRWNKTDFIYTFETGNQIEFFSLDMPHKVRGPRRKRLFINEANNISKETFDQLEVRTEKDIWLDWNPTNAFWFHEDILGVRDDVDFIILTYRDNEGLPESIVQSIESRKSNKNWWRVYGEGEVGETEGRIYTDWKIIPEIPHEATLVRRGLDFGYSVDPTAVVDVYKYNDGIILSERLYKKGMLNNNIADFLNSIDNPNVLVVADSAEPKSIDEISGYGVTIVGAVKTGTPGKSYLKTSIDNVQQKRISVTKSSVNLIREYRNYLWMTDRNGKMLNEPTPGNDHALDAARYAIDNLGRASVSSPHAHKPQNMLRRKYGR